MTCPKSSVHSPDRVRITVSIWSPLLFRPALDVAHLVEALLKRFQLDPEAFNLARQIYRQIQVKTATLGSGHELGAGVMCVLRLLLTRPVSSTSVPTASTSCTDD
jgi:hypothetical protein